MSVITPNSARNPVTQLAGDEHRAVDPRGIVSPCDAERNGAIFRQHQNAARMREQLGSGNAARPQLPPDMVEQAGRVFRERRALAQLIGPAQKNQPPILQVPDAGVQLRR